MFNELFPIIERSQLEPTILHFYLSSKGQDGSGPVSGFIFHKSKVNLYFSSLEEIETRLLARINTDLDRNQLKYDRISFADINYIGDHRITKRTRRGAANIMSFSADTCKHLKGTGLYSEMVESKLKDSKMQIHIWNSLPMGRILIGYHGKYHYDCPTVIYKNVIEHRPDVYGIFYCTDTDNCWSDYYQVIDLV